MGGAMQQVDGKLVIKEEEGSRANMNPEGITECPGTSPRTNGNVHGNTP